MRTNAARWIRTTTLGVAAVVVFGGGTAWASPNGAGMDCEVFDNPMTCYSGGDGYQGSGVPQSTTAVGRTFLTDSDVASIDARSVSARYVAGEWDAWLDFVDALSTFWNLNAPIDRSCTITSDTGTGSGNGCLTMTFSSDPTPDGAILVTMTPVPPGG